MEAGVPRETGQARPQEMLGGADSFANLSEAVRRLHWEALTHVEGGVYRIVGSAVGTPRIQFSRES